MYYWQSDTPQFIPEGDWDEERENYGSYDGKIKPKIKDDSVNSKAKKRTKNVLQLEIAYGIRKEVVDRRIKAGWNREKALSYPLAHNRRPDRSKAIFVDGEQYSFAQFAAYIGVTYSQLIYKFKKDAIAKTHWQEEEVAQLIENWYEKTKTDSR